MRLLSASRGAVCAAAAVCVLPLSAHAFMSSVNGLGQGFVQEQLWVFPNHPPATPNFVNFQQNPPIATLGPVPGADPRTHVQFAGLDHWQVNANFEAASGDSVDWHSMLAYVTPTSDDASGSVEISAMVTSPTSATFTVIWSGSDPGVAMHIGWFEGGAELFETPVMIGPFSETDVYTISSTGPIDLVDMEVSAAAVSLVPAPGACAVLGLAGMLAARRRR